MSKKSRISLVTGAAGFVGKQLVRELLSKGENVRAMVRKQEDVSELQELGAEVIIADLKNKASLSKAVEDVQIVYHIAAIFRQAGLPDEEFFRVNAEGTKDLLDASISAGVKRFIHCSTVGVHGHIENPPGKENTQLNPGDVYQRSKLQGEEIARSYFQRGLIRGVVIRPAMIYGPGDTRTFKLFKMIAERKFIFIGHSNVDLHFIDVRDLAKGFYLAGSRDDINNEVFILAGKEAVPLRLLTKKIACILDVPPPKFTIPALPIQLLGSACEAICTPLKINPPIYRRRVDFFTKSRNFDYSKAGSDLGYQPTQDIWGELVDIVDSYTTTGKLNTSELQQPLKIVRCMDGLIRKWDTNAEWTYGWEEKEAIGKQTHSLFSTQFPESLDRINDDLRKNKIWFGNLIHKKHDGQTIKVLSHWRLKNTNCKDVIEVNRVRQEKTKNPSIGSRLVWAGQTASGFFLEELPSLGLCAVA